nr:hypothetical protein [Tanacetum cinerariifolium]
MEVCVWCKDWTEVKRGGKGEEVVLSSMESLKRMVHVSNILSAGYLTTPQMVLNSPCLTHIKNWLIQIKQSLFWTTVAIKKVKDITRLQALVDKKKVVVTESTIRDALCLDDVEVLNVYLDAGISINLLQDLMDTCTTLTRRVEYLKLDKIAQALKVTKLKQRVKKLEKRNKLKVLKLRRLKRVGLAQRIDTSDDTVMDDDEESEPIELQEVVEVVTTAKIITKVVSAASDTIIAASTAITATDVPIPAAITDAAPTLTAAPRRRIKAVVIRDPEQSTTSIIIHSEAKSKDKGKGILVEEPKPFKKQAQIEQDEKYARELEAELNKTIDWDEVINHVNKKAKEDNTVKRYQAIKRKPQTEAQARKNMMIYLRNVMDEEDSRALKRLNENQEEKAAKKHKEDLEALWRLVKERFAITKPKNFFDDFLLITLGAMFEKPDIHAQIWKNQRSVHGQAKVKS